ncbi:WG repeat-containing protein [bacterium]|nr:WG repeat-containing protein [bacterium]
MLDIRIFISMVNAVCHRFSLIVGVSILCVACSGKKVTEFEDKTPIVEKATEESSEFLQEFEIEYSNFSTTKASLEKKIKKLSSLKGYSKFLTILTSSSMYARETFKVMSKEAITSHATTYLDSLWLGMEQDSTPPASTLTLYMQTNHYHEEIPENHYEVVNADIKQVNFLNGDKRTLSLAVDKAVENTAIFNRFDARIVDDLSATITIEYPVEYTVISLSDSQPSVNFGGHTIELDRLGPDQVTLSYSSDIGDLLADTSGWHVNGKALGQTFSSEKTVPNPDALQFFKALNAHYQASLKALSSGGFTNVQQLQEYIAADMPSEPKNVSPIVTKDITFNGPVNEIRFVLKSQKKQTLTRLFTTSNSEVENNSVSYFPARDTATDKYGLVGELGEWRVKPEYDYLEFNMAHYFTGKAGESFILDKPKGTLIPVDYKPIGELKSNLLLVSNVKSESEESPDPNNKGVFNNQTNQLLIPMEYYRIYIDNDLLVVDKILPDNDNVFGVYNTKGDTVLPLNYRSIDVNNKFIYTGRGSPVFDKSGKQLTPPGWRPVGKYGKDKLLLIHNCESDYPSKVCKRKFIDDQGEVAISLDKFDYAEVLAFSNGYSAIQNKKGLMGYINAEGTLVIPFKYAVAHSFHEKYALVKTTNGDEMLIDSRQRVFKNFKDTIQQHQYSSDGSPTVYLLKDGSRYNGNGEHLPDAE